MTDLLPRSITGAASSASNNSLRSEKNVPLNPHAIDFVPATCSSSSGAAVDRAPAASTSTARAPAIKVQGRDGVSAPKAGAQGHRNKSRHTGGGSSGWHEERRRLPVRSGDVRVQQAPAAVAVDGSRHSTNRHVAVVRDCGESVRGKNRSRRHDSAVGRGGQPMSNDFEPATRSVSRTDGIHGDAAKLDGRKSRNRRARR